MKIVLIPHNNTIDTLEKIRTDYSFLNKNTTNLWTPVYPLFAPIQDEFCNNDIKAIKKTLITTTIKIEKPLIKSNKLVLPLKGLPFESAITLWQADKNKKLEKTPELKKGNINFPLNLTVYRICQLEIIPLSPCGYRWKIGKTLWIKTKL